MTECILPKISNIMRKQLENKSRQTLIQIHVAFYVRLRYKQRWQSTSTNNNDWSLREIKFLCLLSITNSLGEK